MRLPISFSWWVIQQVAQVAAIVGLTQLLSHVFGRSSTTSELLVFGCVVVAVVAVTYSLRSVVSKRWVRGRDNTLSA